MRVYPVPFRRLDETEQYRKFDWVECDLTRNTSDPRPETYRPSEMRQLVPVAHMDAADNWRERRRLLLGRARVYTNLATLIADAKANVASLAVFKPTTIRDFIWEAEDREWDEAKLTEMRNRTAQSELFAEETWRETFKVSPKQPYSFSYRSADDTGTSSELQVLDWKAGASIGTVSAFHMATRRKPSPKCGRNTLTSSLTRICTSFSEPLRSFISVRPTPGSSSALFRFRTSTSPTSSDSTRTTPPRTCTELDEKAVPMLERASA